MTNRPIPRRGLLGAWFLTDRGITYDAGANEAIDRSGRGNHAEYRNGVTVGVEGDPSRDFGAAAFDASSNQFADVGDPLPASETALVAVAKTDVLDNNFRGIIGNSDGVDFGSSLRISNDDIPQFILSDTNAGLVQVTGDPSDIAADTYFTWVGSIVDGAATLYINNKLTAQETANSVDTSGSQNLIIGSQGASADWDGEIAAAAKYDLTVPDAPEPSEIARRWDRLTDIPATR